MRTKRTAKSLSDTAREFNNRAHVLRCQIDALDQVLRRLRRELKDAETSAHKAWTEFGFASAKETEAKRETEANP